MLHQTMLAIKKQELWDRWGRLSNLLHALQQQRDIENHVDEQIRLNAIIAQREAERQQVYDQLLHIEQELHSLRLAIGDSASDPMPPVPSSPIPASRPLRLFYSYSHKDEALRDKLNTQLSILQRQNLISVWHDRGIQAGTVWEDQITEHLESADIILLLVSADFIASDYCWGKEVKRAMERHTSGSARVIPILLREVVWTGAPFGILQALPKDAKPVTSWANEDAAFADIARGIQHVVTTWTPKP